PERRRMAMIFQSYALWPHLTVAQNVGYGLRFKRGMTRTDRDRRVSEMLRFEIRRLHETFGITTLYVTHDQAEAMVISDRIAVLDRGRVAQVGSAEEI